MFLSNPAVTELEPYTPGLSREFVSQKYGVALDDVAKLGSAENPLGPSPLAKDREYAGRIAHWGAHTRTRLRLKQPDLPAAQPRPRRQGPPGRGQEETQRGEAETWTRDARLKLGDWNGARTRNRRPNDDKN